ncbi:MAG: hypothetical protein ABJ327_17835 [Litoreibacter sp.]
MTRIRMIIVTFALLAPSAGVLAFQTNSKPSIDEMKSRYLEVSMAECPAETKAFTSMFPEHFLNLASPVKEKRHTFSNNHLQLVLWVMIQAEQVGYMIGYTAHIGKVYSGENADSPEIKVRAHALTDLAKCLTPVGSKFSDSREEGIAELSEIVTKDLICTKWQAYSDRVLSLDNGALTVDAFSDALTLIESETVETCPKIG